MGNGKYYKLVLFSLVLHTAVYSLYCIPGLFYVIDVVEYDMQCTSTSIWVHMASPVYNIYLLFHVLYGYKMMEPLV